MTKTHISEIDKLHQLFTSNFMKAYKNADVYTKKQARPFLQPLYRRWYYSTMIEETPFTPANIVESVCKYYNQPQALYPVAKLRGKSKLTGIDMELIEYSLDKHPIVTDLKNIIEYCTPHLDLGQEGLFTTAQAQKAGEMTTLKDALYALYLLELALSMKLVVKVPSVGVNRFKPSGKATKFFQATDMEIFHNIVETGITLAAKGLQNFLDIPETVFSKTFIRSILHAPMETDEIFERVYDAMGYSMEDLMDMDDDDFGDADMNLISGTFMTGILLDKLFFAPFGHYMKLIRPLYILPFEFENEIQELVASALAGNFTEAQVAYFAPCSSYTLTDIGLEYFKQQKTDDNYLCADQVVQYKEIKDTIFSSLEALQVFMEVGKLMIPLDNDMEPQNIYTFRARLENDTSIWAHIQMPSDDTLHDMYEELIDCFGLKLNNDYTFYHDKIENRFAQYSPSMRTKRSKKTSDTTLIEDLDFEHQKQMLLLANNQSIPFGEKHPVVRVQLEMLSIKPPDKEMLYPRVSRVSKGFLSRSHDDEF